ncbi:MAG: TRCF domain-containing protein, partial [Thermoanaerobaculia bacterium]
QSGEIAAVGFEMYTRLLDEAIRELRGEKIEEEIETQISLALDIYIPRDYIDDESIRMTLYKKIAAARDETRLDEIRTEMRDRFGALPPNVDHLIAFIALRLLARRLGVLTIVRERNIAAVKLHPSARIDPARLLELLEQDPEAKFSPAGVLTLPLRQSGAAIIGEIASALQSIAGEAIEISSPALPQRER